MLDLVICDPLTSTTAADNPTPRDQLLVDPGRTQVRFTTLAPGGFGSLTLGMPERRAARQGGVGPLPRSSALLDFDCHVQVWAGSALAFAGQVVQLQRGGDGLPNGCTVEGYGISGVVDGAFTSTATAPLTSGQLAAQAVTTLSAYLRQHGVKWTDPGVLHAPSEFDFATLADILGQIVKEGDGQGTVYDWFVYERAMVQLVPRTQPATPDYVVPLDARLDWQEDGRKRCSGVTLRYSTPETVDAAGNTVSGEQRTLTITNPNWTGARARLMAINGGTLSDTAAAAFARAYYSVHASADLAITINRVGPLDGVPQPGGAERPLYLARAGDWVQLGDSTDYQMVTRSDYDSERQTLALKLGAAYVDATDLYAQQRQIAQAVVTGRNPITGAPK